ncbi:neuronal calcium sensor 2 [Eurytemora carolleeae]|uniref:neuronal calcium sensor 2 n=1 Tax=Eurytemora carolleeae TaxID=1294199 RepID=UPI000C760697|nr:neuronal calcium sensor 2 [Eurytemora carolleeae]|eukprot:XP_023336550.1 neuronal calcium sensor 2-like [Eurytemora affinis]
MGVVFSAVTPSSVITNKLCDEDRKWMELNTKIKPGDMDSEYNKFYKKYPKGGIYRHQFANLFPSMMTVHFCDHVFRTLDLDGNGYLDFKEFMMANDLVNAKTPEDKLSWAFKVYDVDKSGAIDQKEMVRVMKSIYLMVGHTETNRDALQDQAEAHAVKLFKALDVDGDKELSEEEFIKGCKEDKELMAKLQKLVEELVPKKK